MDCVKGRSRNVRFNRKERRQIRTVTMSNVEDLKLRLSQLEEELEDTRNNLYRAAECGNTLLNTNQLLNERLEAREKEYSEQLEVNPC